MLVIIARYHEQRQRVQQVERGRVEAATALATAREDVATRDNTLSAKAAQIEQLLKDREAAMVGTEKLSVALTNAERKITETTQRLSTAEVKVDES